MLKTDLERGGVLRSCSLQNGSTDPGMQPIDAVQYAFQSGHNATCPAGAHHLLARCTALLACGSSRGLPR